MSWAGVTPLVGETISQLPPLPVVAPAAKDVPLPEDVTEAVWAEGDGWPATAEKVKVVGLTVTVCGVCTVRVTGMVIGLPVDPVEVMVTLPL